MTEFQIHYLSECPQCGGDISDPFMDDLCFECDHSRHSVAPWDAPDCELCWPDPEDDYPDEDDEEPARPVEDVQVSGDRL